MDSLHPWTPEWDTVRGKAGGFAKYIADLSFPEMIYGRIVSCPVAHAEIESVTVPDLPTGYSYIDARGIPGKNRIKMIADDWPILAEDHVNYPYEPIGILVGPDKERLDALVGAVIVAYKELPLTASLDEPGASSMVNYTIGKGDHQKAFQDADDTFTETYHTGAQEQLYLEPQGMTALWEDGKVTVYGSMQCPYYVKAALEQGLSLPSDDVRVVQTMTGGGFGGKEDYPSLIGLYTAIASNIAGKPVQMVLDRKEDIAVTPKRHPSKITITSAVKHGRVTAMDIDITLDGGAYEGLSAVVLQRALFNATGAYDIPSVHVVGRVVKTNTTPAGAFRGFGAPQAVFAVEAHMDLLAQETGINPMEFKLNHALREGSHTVTSGTVRGTICIDKLVKSIDHSSGFSSKYALYRGMSGRKRRGVGMSLFNHGCGFTGSGERDKIKAKVTLRRLGKGAEILVSSVDFGQGPKTTLRAIAAESLGVPLDQIRYENPDTDRVPDSGPTVASRTAMVVGELVKRAAEKLGAEPETNEVTELYRQPPGIEWDQETLKGDAYPVFSWGVNVVEVETDIDTMETDIVGIWAVYDVGVTLDETIVRGQMEGGIAQGIGLAAWEKLERRGCAWSQATITDYVIPGSLELPMMHIEFFDNPFPYGPAGAKCVGELPLVGSPPAYAAAVAMTIDLPVTSIPITPESMLELVI